VKKKNITVLHCFGKPADDSDGLVKLWLEIDDCVKSMRSIIEIAEAFDRVMTSSECARFDEIERRFSALQFLTSCYSETQ
jgi:hypothetical protein